jgi:hypothetical protein
MNPVTRRQFIRTGAIVLGAPCIIPASVLGADAPSKKITVGFIGTGDHGTNWNLRRYLNHKDAKIVMVCDVDRLLFWGRFSGDSSATLHTPVPVHTMPV